MLQFPASQTDRRNESRFKTVAGQRLQWSNQSSWNHASRAGWFMDVSRSGVGLLVERAELPRLGDLLDVRIRTDADPVCYEVVRVQQGQQRLAIVGCQRMYGRTANLDLPDAAWQLNRAA